jgi:hypothetical protein
VTYLTVTAVIRIVDVALRSYLMTPANETKLTNPEEVQDVIRGVKVNKAPGPNRASKHRPQRALFLHVMIFNAILFTHHFPTVREHDREITKLE